MRGMVRGGDALYHLVRDPPHGQCTISGPGHQELIIQPSLGVMMLTCLDLSVSYLIKYPVIVGILANHDGVQGWQPVDGHVVAVPGSGGQQGSARVDLDTVNAAVLNLMGFKFL